MREELELILSDFKHELESTNSINDLESLRAKYLMKGGKISLILSEIKNIPDEDRPVIGKIAHETRSFISKSLEDKEVFLSELAIKTKIENDRIDIHAKSRRRKIGKLSTESILLEKINSFFLDYGFKIYESSKEKLISSFIDGNETISIPLKENELPLRAVTLNKLYNKSSFEPSYLLEGVIIDKNLKLSEIKGLINELFSTLFSKEINLVSRPNYLGIMSPSLNVGLENDNNEFCSIMSYGMIIPKYLEDNNINSKEYNGFVLFIDIEKLINKLT